MRDDFRFFDLGLASRLALSGGLFAAGIALELALADTILPGLLLLLAGWFPLMLRKASNEPDDQGFEEWRPVSMAEIDRLDDGINESRELRRRTLGCGSGLALIVGLPLLFVALVAAFAEGRADFAFVLGNAALLLAPAALFGRVRAFVPRDISMKMPSFRAILSESLPGDVVVSPYIRFDKDASGGDVPEDLRMLLELKRPPADLVGIQVQAAINDGPNGAVPYLYAVVLTKGREGSSYAIARRSRASGFEVEPGGEGEYGTVVIRQSTEGGGYETKPDECRELMRVCVDLLRRMKAA